jgi:hypothetical protein
MELLSDAERFVASLMDVPRAAPRLRALSLKFTAAEKAAEAAAVFQVRARVPVRASVCVFVCVCVRVCGCVFWLLSASFKGCLWPFARDVGASLEHLQCARIPGAHARRNARAPQCAHAAMRARHAQDHIGACKDLRSSPTFRQLLAAALAAGNFVNHGSRIGNAAGFRRAPLR